MVLDGVVWVAEHRHQRIHVILWFLKIRIDASVQQLLDVDLEVAFFFGFDRQVRPVLLVRA